MQAIGYSSSLFTPTQNKPLVQPFCLWVSLDCPCREVYAPCLFPVFVPVLHHLCALGASFWHTEVPQGFETLDHRRHSLSAELLHQAEGILLCWSPHQRSLPHIHRFQMILSLCGHFQRSARPHCNCYKPSSIWVLRWGQRPAHHSHIQHTGRFPAGSTNADRSDGCIHYIPFLSSYHGMVGGCNNTDTEDSFSLWNQTTREPVQTHRADSGALYRAW